MPDSGLRIIQEQIGEAIAAPKCHKCGCFHKTVEALLATEPGAAELAPLLSAARTAFVPKMYDCLGCPICYPAIAANAFVEAYPEAGATLDLCPTEEPELRAGWPSLPGDYYVLRYRAPVAVCTLNSTQLADELRDRSPEGLAIAGTMHTENLGIERVIKNVSANPHIRFLIVCGEDTRQVIGHLPGQSLASLFSNGVDERGRIRGARGKRPVLKNVPANQIDAFRAQVELISLIGEQQYGPIAEHVERCVKREPGPYTGVVPETRTEVLKASEPQLLVLDSAGYFVIYPEPRRDCLVVEHYLNTGAIDCVIEGSSVAAIYATAIRRNLLTRLDHAAYLGMELVRAERSLRVGEPYVQDRAPGAIASEDPLPSSKETCECSGEPCS